MNDEQNNRGELFRMVSVCFAIAAITAAVYWPVSKFGFVNYDDTAYVSENQTVKDGLTPDGIEWAFRTGFTGNWHPVTWLSLMLDCELFGANPGALHLVNLFFHIANSLLLLGLLKKLTGSFWQSAFVAALFALHPLHVESVAWISERKDVLSTFYLLLTLLAYSCYVKKTNAANYLLVLVLFALGLMSKPMLVTVPFVLLLLDFWPINRGGNLKRLVVEKIPMLVLVLVISAVTFFAQRDSGAVAEDSSIVARFENAILSYGQYQVKTIWPQHLAIPYLFPEKFSSVAILVAGAVLMLITKWAMVHAKRRPWFITGWLWYLVTLLPVIGLVQVGSQSMADRYTYIPLIGIFIVVAWGLKELVEARKNLRIVSILAAAASLAACAVVSSRQVTVWENTETLFGNTIVTTKNNYVAYFSLANELNKIGRFQDAVTNYEAALRIRADFPLAHNHLAIALVKLGRTNDAIAHLNEALRLKPDLAEARQQLESLGAP